MSCTEARAEISAAAAEMVAEKLNELGDPRWSVIEDVIAKRAWVLGIFVDAVEARTSWDVLEIAIRRVALGEPVIAVLPDEDWRESYKAHFKPWRTGRLHWVPEWERKNYKLPRGDVAVWLEPGLAFGTGNHETTRLCVLALVALAKRLTPKQRRALRVIDAGCGSGILAISAAKLGFEKSLAFDNDAEAVAVARKNVRRNGVSSAIRCTTADLERGLAKRTADVLLANIQADVLMAHAALLVGAVAPGGMLVLSGILAVEVARVLEAFRTATGARGRLKSRTLREWSSVVWTAPRS